MNHTRFGPFVLDEDQRRLFRADAVVSVSPKAYDLLVTLVHERPRVISKTDLHSRLWPTTFVSDVTLAALVAELRRALGDSSKTPAFIRTSHGFGYAFCGEVMSGQGTRRADSQSASVRPEFHWIEWGNGEYRCDIREGDNVIGRDPDVAVCVDLPTVSRRHAVLTRRGAEVVLRDLGSKNGTAVWGKRLDAPRPLVDGDEVLVGSIAIVYRNPQTPASTLTDTREP